jgi:adenylosuccinate synthase
MDPPARAEDWEACVPVYETFAGWDADITGVRRFEDLPGEAQVYVRALQDLMGVHIEMISVGAERDCVIPTTDGVPVPA